MDILRMWVLWSEQYTRVRLAGCKVGHVVVTDSTKNPGTIREIWDSRWRIINLRQQARSTCHCYKETPESTPLELGVPQSYPNPSSYAASNPSCAASRKPQGPGGLGTRLDLLPSWRMDGTHSLKILGVGQMKPNLHPQDNTATLYRQSWDLAHMQASPGAASCLVFNHKAAIAKTGGAV